MTEDKPPVADSTPAAPSNGLDATRTSVGEAKPDASTPVASPAALGATVTSVGAMSVQVPGSLFAGRYRILEMVGVGGMGMVYHAFDERLELPVALKLLRPERAADQEMKDRFRRELILARQVSHRNVVRIHDLGETEDVYFLTMDYVEGRSLKELLAEEGPLDPERVVEIAQQITGALAAAHREGVVHRDLKPANIMIDHEGRAFVTDFGIASSASAVGLTATGGIVGTPDYLAPEQARGEAVDPRADLYALGLILFELSSRRLPFAGGSLTEVLAQRISGRAMRLEEVADHVPKGLSQIIARCLERDPEDRYQSAEDIAADLAAGRATGGAFRSGWRKTRSLIRRHAVSILAAAVIVISVLALASLFEPAEETAPGPRHSVAILPLADETGRADLAWLATGLPEMLAGNLAESAELRVIDSMRVSRTLGDLGITVGTMTEVERRLISDLLGTDRLVSGRVRVLGESVRVDVQLVPMDAEEPVAESFHVEAPLDRDLLSVVEKLDRELCRRLGVPSPAAAMSLPAQGADVGGDYVRGLDAIGRGDLSTAVTAFEGAVAGTPELTPAWAHLSRLYGDMGFADKARQAVDKALAGTRENSRIGLLLNARAALLAGEGEVAVGHLQTLAERFPFDSEGRLELAQFYGATGRFEEASKELEALTDEDAQHPQAWFLLGKFAILMGESRRAVDEYLTRALVIHNRLDNLSGQGEVLNAFGIAYQKLGDMEDAERRYLEAADIRRQTGDLRGQSSSLFNLAILRARRGHFDAARDDLQQVLAVRRDIGDERGVASAYNHLGHVLEQQGLYRQAREQYVAGLEGRRPMGNGRAIAESLNNVGFMDFLLGDYDRASDHWREAIDIYRADGNPEGEALVAQSIARLDLTRGAWQSALDAVLASLESSRASGRRDAEAVALGLLARAAHGQGRLAAARKSFDEALAIFEELGEVSALTELTLARAELLLELGAFDAAELDLERAELWLQDRHHHERNAELLRLQGFRHLAQGQLDASTQAFEASLDAAELSGSREAELWARLGLGQTELAAGATARARTLLENVAEAGRALGHARLQVRAALPLARAYGLGERIGAAESTLRAALELAEARAPLGGSHLVHWRLAKVLDQRGLDAEARAQLEKAALVVARIRESLDAPDRATFDRLPEVQTLEQEIAERGIRGLDTDTDAESSGLTAHASVPRPARAFHGRSSGERSFREKCFNRRGVDPSNIEAPHVDDPRVCHPSVGDSNLGAAAAG